MFPLLYCSKRTAQLIALFSFKDVPGGVTIGSLLYADIITVSALRLDGLSYEGEYTPVSTDTLGYRLAHKTIRFLSYKLRPTVQFMMRADEVAFYRFGLEQDFVSNWIQGPTWTHSSAWAASIALGDTLTLSYQKGLVEKKIAVSSDSMSLRKRLPDAQASTT